MMWRSTIKAILRRKIGRTYVNAHVAIHRFFRAGFRIDGGRFDDVIFGDGLLINYVDLDIYLGFVTVHLNLNRARRNKK